MDILRRITNARAGRGVEAVGKLLKLLFFINIDSLFRWKIFRKYIVNNYTNTIPVLYDTPIIKKEIVMYKNRCYMPFLLYPPDMYDVSGRN